MLIKNAMNYRYDKPNSRCCKSFQAGVLASLNSKIVYMQLEHLSPIHIHFLPITLQEHASQPGTTSKQGHCHNLRMVPKCVEGPSPGGLSQYVSASLNPSVMSAGGRIQTHRFVQLSGLPVSLLSNCPVYLALRSEATSKELRENNAEIRARRHLGS